MRYLSDVLIFLAVALLGVATWMIGVEAFLVWVALTVAALGIALGVADARSRSRSPD